MGAGQADPEPIPGEQSQEQPFISTRAGLWSRFGQGRNTWAGRCNCRSAMLFIYPTSEHPIQGRAQHWHHEGAAPLGGRDVRLQLCLLCDPGGHCAPSLPGQGQPEWLLIPFLLSASDWRLVLWELQWKLPGGLWEAFPKQGAARAPHASSGSNCAAPSLSTGRLLVHPGFVSLGQELSLID